MELARAVQLAGRMPCSVGEKDAGRWAMWEKGNLRKIGARARPGIRLAEVGLGGPVVDDWA